MFNCCLSILSLFALKMGDFLSCLKVGICIPREIVKCKAKKIEQAAEVLKFDQK